jgi:hypothetical protein
MQLDQSKNVFAGSSSMNDENPAEKYSSGILARIWGNRGIFHHLDGPVSLHSHFMLHFSISGAG